MTDLPAGIVTFLFTDIEGSTRLWQEHPGAMPAALARHHVILKQAIGTQHGYVFQIVGDAFCAAFKNATDALEAALAAQRALRDEAWGETGPIRVRMALQTGPAEVRVGEYTSGEYVSGLTLSRSARLLSAGHGGQILLSLATQELIRDYLSPGVTLRDMGQRRLKDLIRPEHIFQVVVPDLPADFAPLKTLDARPNNLPVQVTSFVGRERELIEVKDRLKATHVLTLTGLGGTGKTRLSLQAAADLIDDFSYGVWFIELAPLSDPALVPQAIATALGLREEAKRPLMETLIDHLREKQSLLVLDNCEHLIEACARLADSLIRVSPELKILASSRKPLRIVGETTYPVPTLPSPNPQQLPSLESLSNYEAVRLFRDRAVAVAPTFQVTQQNALAVTQICHRLDGLPLALELAAARVKIMTVEKIAERLDDRFRLLTGGSRTALPRQQTLQALIDWSYDLLSESERVLWRRLSIFAGGWTLEAAEMVCVGESIAEYDVLDLLTQLVDKSLVIMEEKSGEGRYRLLETVRQYGYEKLVKAVEVKLIRDRHLDFFLKFAEEAEPKLQGAEQKLWLNRLETEHDNLRAVLAWSVESSEKAETGLQLAGVLWRFWEVRGHFTEGRRWLEEALTRTPARTAARAKALNGGGNLALDQGDYIAARLLYQESLAIQRELENKGGIAASLHNLGNVAYMQGNFTEARSLYEESLAIKRELGDQRGIAYSFGNLGGVAHDQGDYIAARSFHLESLAIKRNLGDKRGIAASINNLGEVARAQGDYTEARSLYEESLAIKRELGDKRGITFSLNNLGNVAYAQGDYVSARAFYQESLSIQRELVDKQRIAESLEGLAGVDCAEGQFERATQLLGAVESLRKGIGTPLSSLERTEYERTVAAARAARGEEAFAKAWAKGGRNDVRASH
ncbi:tetratricopeptide repeat protein [Candidatus Acetothermia bacterium]|nr:tetratricopeptide repeat protein [Candidatus Acetothermia bacterium]